MFQPSAGQTVAWMPQKSTPCNDWATELLISNQLLAVSKGGNIALRPEVTKVMFGEEGVEEGSLTTLRQKPKYLNVTCAPSSKVGGPEGGGGYLSGIPDFNELIMLRKQLLSHINYTFLNINHDCISAQRPVSFACLILSAGPQLLDRS